jgi:DNA sulfur modification protein DndB
MARRKTNQQRRPKASGASNAVEPGIQILGPVVSDKFERIAEYKRRKPRLFQKRLKVSDAESFLAGGWTQRRLLPNGRALIEKSKSHDEILENRFWSILYQLGFDELNSTRSFQIQVTSNEGSVRKQIDVFGRLGNVIVVAECKSCAKKQQRSLQKDIGEFASYQRAIANSLGNTTVLEKS